MTVPAVTKSTVKHARQSEAALGRGKCGPAEAAVVAVVLRAASGQKLTADAVHLHMVGQTPKVHLVQAVGMLMIRRSPCGGREGREAALTANPLDVTASLHFELKAGLPSYRISFARVPPVVIFSCVFFILFFSSFNKVSQFNKSSFLKLLLDAAPCLFVVSSFD